MSLLKAYISFKILAEDETNNLKTVNTKGKIRRTVHYFKLF